MIRLAQGLALTINCASTLRHAFSPLAISAALAVGLMLVTPVRAQTLLELYEAARGYDATYLAARALDESAPFKAAQAKARRRPSADLSGSVTRSEDKFPRAAAQTVGSDNSALSLSGKYPLLNRADDAFIAQADKLFESSGLDLSSAEQDLIIRVAQAYFDVLAAQDTLGTASANKAAIAEQLASAQRNFEVGTAPITDTREAQARFDLATAQEIAADNDLLTARIALDQLVGRNNVVPRRLANPVALRPIKPESVEEWVRQADAAHPDIQLARLAFEIAELETARARADHFPTVDVVASASKSHVTDGGITTLSGTTDRASVGLQLNLPLFSGFSTENRIRETLLLQEKARNDLESAGRTVALETRRSFYNVRSGLAQVRALEAAESSNQLALEATQLGYDVGVRVNLDVLNAQKQLFDARRDLAKARYNVLVNGLRLLQASGQLQPQDVAAVNLLLEQCPAPLDAAEPTGNDEQPSSPTQPPCAPAPDAAEQVSDASGQ